MPSDSKYTQQQTNTNQNSPEYQLISLPSTRDHSTVEMQLPSQQSSISHTLTGFGIGDDEIIPMEVEEAEKLVEEYRLKYNKTVTWIPRTSTKGDIIFYCEQLDVYCESLPLILFDGEASLPNLEYPGAM